MVRFLHLLSLSIVAFLSGATSLSAQFGSTFDPHNPYSCNYYPQAEVEAKIIRPAADDEVSGIVKITKSAYVNYRGSASYNCYPKTTSSTMTYTISGGPLDQSISSATNTIDTSELEPGRYRIDFVAKYVVEYPSGGSSYSFFSGRTSTITGRSYRYVNVVRDEQPPELNITYPLQGGTIRGIARIRANATDDSGIRDMHVLLGNRDLGIYEESDLDINVDTRGLRDGLALLQIRAVDRQNIPITAQISVNIDNIDEAPEISFVDLFDTQSVSGLINLRTDTFDDRGIEYVKFFVDGEEIFTDFTEPYDAPIDTELYQNGPHQVAAIATDTKGETTSASIQLVFQNGDISPPLAQITSLQEKSRVNGEITVIARAEDDSGIEKVDFFIGATLIDTVTVPPYQISYDTTQIANGIYNFGVVAYDKANNFGTDDVIVVVENGDNLNSSVFITKPSPEAVLSGFAELEALAVDNVAVKEVRFLLNNKIVGATKLSPYTYILDTTRYQDGAYTLTVQAFDYSDNFGEETIRIRIDNTNPVPGGNVTNSAPAGATVIRGYSVQIAEQIDLIGTRRSSLSSTMVEEHSMAFNDLMAEMMKEVKANKKALRKKRKLKKVPRFARKARKSLRRAFRNNISDKALNRTKNKLMRIVKAFDSLAK